MSPSFCGSGPYPCGSLTYRVRGQYTTASNTVSRKFFSTFMGIFPVFSEKEREFIPIFQPRTERPGGRRPPGERPPAVPMPVPEGIAPFEKICRRRAETPSKNAAAFAPHRGGPRLSSDGFCSAEVFQQIEGIRAETRIPSGTSGPVSRVLSFKTAIYLDALLPTRSSRLPGTAGPAYASLHGVAPDRVYSDGRFHTPSGELLPHLSTFAAPWRGGSLFLLHFS